MTNKRSGNISVPRNILVQPEEYVVATVLSWTGQDVRFISPGIIPRPDIKFRGKEWEIKTPSGKSSRTIENNIRVALKQSRNIVINLQRMSIDERKCITEIKRQNSLIKQKHQFIIITKNLKIIEL
ncbi:hypothetical protein IJ098_02320 [Candidatus Saccharibacteria bacterium]|nr:hypothetical protein [Candidatus Saccharibacteria bacterium]